MINLLCNRIAKSLLLGWMMVCLFSSCGDSDEPKEVVLVDKPEEVPVVVSEQINTLLQYVQQKSGKLNDSTLLVYPQLVQEYYQQKQFQPVWSAGGQWNTLGDSLFYTISQCREMGLFPVDYHHPALLGIRNKMVLDDVSRKNAALWARADILLTDAFFAMAQHLKYGHLQRDSVTIRKDSVLTDSVQLAFLAKALASKQIRSTLAELEPNHPDYVALKVALRNFLKNASFQPVEKITYPATDSATLVQQVAARLTREGLLDSSWKAGDSLAYAAAIKKYQAANNIITTGVAATLTVASMNMTDADYFNIAALNLDRFRQLPDTLPPVYVWVNLPAYKLKVLNHDTVALESKVIVGASKTPTPVLNSSITNFITYPQWTVPYSIIFKEMLPKIKKDIGYLAKENLMVVDKYDSVIAPETIDWEKVTRNSFPYLIRQRQGDDNSLGVMKFNFRNKYSVYLHDTNARGLFAKDKRALSHGCVRVQQWEELSHFLVRNNEVRYPPDTITALIVRQEKKTIADFSPVPIYIRYITAEGNQGKIRFFSDIYEEDKRLIERYFASKSNNR